MGIKFTKMQALGNDFVVIDAMSQVVAIGPEQARRIADRRLGVGCDQIILVENPSSDDVDFKFRILNADGGEVAQCGNGARCFALFVREAGLTDKTEIKVETTEDVLTLSILQDGQVRVNMAVPRFEPAEIPFIATARQHVYDLALEDTDIEISALSLGNPHAVRVVKDVELAPVAVQGPMIERHQRFPQRVNAGFMQVCGRDHIRLRVYERGVGETPACGSGACAAVVAGRTRALLDESVIVDLPGGRLRVEWSGNAQPVYMTGPAQSVFEGKLTLIL